MTMSDHPNNPRKVERPGEPDVYYIPDEEKRMEQAIQKARLTFGYFISSLAEPKASQVYFSLKAKFTDGIHSEHIWLQDISTDESGNFFGVVGNTPIQLENIQLHQQVGVSADNVSDWLIIEDSRLIGGYTIRALRDGMDEGARQQFDASLGFLIDEGVDYFVHDHSTPEGAILTLEDAYDLRDLDKCIAAKDFRTESMLMLSKMPAFDRPEMREELITRTAEALRLSFVNWVLEQGFPTFTGITRAFPYREAVNENLFIITEVCRLPDNTRTIDRLYVARTDGVWKVAGLVR